MVTITSIEPDPAKISPRHLQPGAHLVIHGSGFTGATSVFVSQYDDFTVDSDTQITVTLPSREGVIGINSVTVEGTRFDLETTLWFGHSFWDDVPTLEEIKLAFDPLMNVGPVDEDDPDEHWWW